MGLHEMQSDLNASLCYLLDERARFPPRYDYNPDVGDTFSQLKTFDIHVHVQELYAKRKQRGGESREEGSRERTQTTGSREPESVPKALGKTVATQFPEAGIPQ